MSEPSAIWSQRAQVFDKSISLTQNVILAQGWVALQTLAKKIDHLHALVKGSPAVKDFHLDPDIPFTLSEICFHQGIASTLLFNDGVKTSRENNSVYRLRLDRIAYVARKLGTLKAPLLSDRKLRNQLFCRTYISSEDVLLHLDQEISLRDLKIEALAVRDAIWNDVIPQPLFTLRRKANKDGRPK